MRWFRCPGLIENYLKLDNWAFEKAPISQISLPHRESILFIKKKNILADKCVSIHPLYPPKTLRQSLWESTVTQNPNRCQRALLATWSWSLWSKLWNPPLSELFSLAFLRGDVKYYFADFIRNGGTSPSLRTKFSVKRGLGIWGVPPPLRIKSAK